MTRIHRAAAHTGARPLKRSKRTCFPSTAAARYVVAEQAGDDVGSSSQRAGDPETLPAPPGLVDDADITSGSRPAEVGAHATDSGTHGLRDNCGEEGDHSVVGASVRSGGGSVAQHGGVADIAPVSDGYDSSASSESDTPFYMGWSDEEDPAAIPQEVNFGRSAQNADASAPRGALCLPRSDAGGCATPTRQTVPPFVVPSEAPASPSAAASTASLHRRLGQVVTCVEELFAHFLLRGQCTITNKAFSIVRAARNYCTTLGPLPSLTTLRTSTLPAIKAAWFLPTRTLSARTKFGGRMAMDVVLPSTHVARDFAFSDTYRLFTAADDRPDWCSETEPEYVDTPFFRARQASLVGAETLTEFSLARETYRAGDALGVRLVDGTVIGDLVVGEGRFAPASAGVGSDDGVHAGDFLVCLYATGEAPRTMSAESGGLDGVQATGRVGTTVVAASAAPRGCGSVEEVLAHEAAGELHVRYWRLGSHPVLSWRRQGHTPRAVERLERCGDGVPPRAPLTRRPLRWVGTDDSPIVLVCLVFYTDDFVPRLRRAASLGGAYMSYVSWAISRRTSLQAVRTIGVTPPDVDSDEVLRFVLPDLVVGMTEGWLVYDPDGKPVRALADVSFFVGDYVQEAKSCRLMGHAALSPCTLCTYRVPGVAGSNYGKLGSSQDVGLMRTTARSVAVGRAARAAGATTQREDAPHAD